MRKILLLSAAAFAVAATPAAARDGSGYFGLEGGVLFPKDMNIEGEFLFDDPDDADFLESDIADVEFNRGLDVDLIAGYDFGAFRVEGELGYKRAKADDLEFDEDFLDAIGVDPDDVSADDVDLDGKVRVVSGMINVLGDFGSDAGFGGYAGLGVGRAGVKAFGDRDSAWAFQAIAGIRTAVSENVDVGLKYRYFRTGKLNFREDLEDDLGAGFLAANERFSSHSLLASLIFNFGAPAVAEVAPPPPPPPPMVEQAPATQTCPDGSVILATSVCPPPPPPPPPPVERGERGQ
jgi:opacity protein-like surface antigen